jgi:hypothetical protein
MSLTGDYDTVETLSSDRADEPLSVWILPWRSRRGRMIAYAHGVDPLDVYLTMDGIAIANQMSWRFLPWKRLG